ncbi:hypothetical protein PUNSTDRAFT_116870 [Punctularia strigosozonata HHB-11173 SS5]|uniref:Uncharacterized protein n=1 Tax=Punctularia strigosozonata (strain HHB-11173) TaxID=741275 RepID=R7S061_PUNST|nr:uncharacterized protein PUNSTDRAFT_116870 [Punctularia strigosozonata HHB-11173 SS5]EIN03740.1 hypothetical protein PUNSTDRAFT_116870 [Punctularia strigosozonata HHB-11173 SS5]
MSPTSVSQPRTVLPHAASGQTIIKPDDAKYPWYQFLILPWTERQCRNYEEYAKMIENIEPLDELPPEFDPWSEPLKYPPPTFYYGWAVDRELALDYARRKGLIEEDPSTVSDPRRAAFIKSWTLVDVQEFLEQVVSLEQSYAVQDPDNPYLLIWSLYDNWKPPDERPDMGDIIELQKDLGYEDGPKWYLSSDTI